MVLFFHKHSRTYGGDNMTVGAINRAKWLSASTSDIQSEI